MQEREACRKHYIALRNEMPREVIISKSEVICETILKSPAYKCAEVIMAYYPLGNEVNCLAVLEDALKNGKRVVLPRTAKHSLMDFYEIRDFSDVAEGTFHVMEPKDDCPLFIPETEEREPYSFGEIFMLVPGVVFDGQGNRYGYGKGYYDRYFARFPELKRIAVAYTEQLSSELLECLETDVKMHMIVTDKETLLIS